MVEADHIRQAVILAGGLGTRLGKLTKTVPKPLLPVGGKPFLSYQIDWLARAGIEDIIISTGHLAGAFEEFISSNLWLDPNGKPVRIRTFKEEFPAGTAGALQLMKDQLDPLFFVVNGDSFLICDPVEIARKAEQMPAGQMLLTVRSVPDITQYGCVKTTKSGRVTRFAEKRQSGPGEINAGISVLNRGVCDMIPGVPSSLEADVYPLLVTKRLLHAHRVDGYFVDIGIPDTYEQAQTELTDALRRPAIFFDRDGVLNRDQGYTHKVEDLHLVPGAAQAVADARRAGYRTVVVSNQSGIARGLYPESAVWKFNQALNSALRPHGGWIDGFYYCPFHVDGTVEEFSYDHPDRKPNPGMIHRAADELNIDLQRSLLIGDKSTDIEAAVNAGIPGFLFDSDRLDEFLNPILSAAAILSTSRTETIQQIIDDQAKILSLHSKLQEQQQFHQKQIRNKKDQLNRISRKLKLRVEEFESRIQNYEHQLDQKNLAIERLSIKHERDLEVLNERLNAKQNEPIDAPRSQGRHASSAAFVGFFGEHGTVARIRGTLHRFKWDTREKLRVAVVKTGVLIVRFLPITDGFRSKIKRTLLHHLGPTLGLRPKKILAPVDGLEISLRRITERYLSLARSATGRPINVPVRSVSIVIPVYNNLEYTLSCVDAIKRNTSEIDYEIIIVDDCSTDGTKTEFSNRDDVVYIRNSENLGFIGSCNTGASKATKTYICYLNNDTTVAPLWLSALVNTFELHDHVGIVGSQLIYPDGRLQEAGGLIWDDFSGWNWGRLSDPEEPKFSYARQADYCSGASIILPRALNEAMGGFDPEFSPAYGEDSDLAFRVRALGLSVIYQPLSRVVHFEGVTSGTDVTKGVKAYQTVNAEKLAKRWSPVLPHQGVNGVNPRSSADRGRIGRILVIDQISPEPDKDAGSITALELMRGLRDMGYKVTFAPCSNFTFIPDYTDLLGALGIESVLFPPHASIEQHLDSLESKYDAVVVFRVNSAEQSYDILSKKSPHSQIVYHASDLHFLRAERARDVANNNIAELQLSVEKTKHTELEIIRKSDLTIVHSHHEKELIGELLPEKPVVVFPWIYQPRSGGNSFSERSDLIYLGGYRHYPNVDAVKHFVEDIFPLLDDPLPDTVFRAIGSNPPDEFAPLASERVVIEGFIENLEPVLSRSRVMVVPLRYGAGLKGKIVTSMAHGLPVVTTTIGAEGMALTNGKNVLIADTPAEFAEAVTRLNNDEKLWNRVSQNGLEYVAKTTSRSAGYEIIRQILNELNLPALPTSNQDNGSPFYQANFGSRSAFQDVGQILQAVVASEGQLPGRLVIVPDAIGDTRVKGWKVASYSTVGAKRKSPRVVAVLELSDDKTAAKMADYLVRTVSKGGVASIVVVPPRLVADASGYVVKRAFSDETVQTGDIRLPAHLRMAPHFAGLEGLTWRADTELTGFPGLMIADWTRA